MARPPESQNDTAEGGESTDAGDDRKNLSVEDAEVVSETPPGGESEVDATPDAGTDRIGGTGEAVEPEAAPDPGAEGESAVEATPDGGDRPREDAPDARGDGGADAATATEPEAAASPPEPPRPAEAAMAGIGMPGAIAVGGIPDPVTDPRAVEPSNTRSLFEPGPASGGAEPARASAAPAQGGGMAVIPLLIGGLLAGLIGVFAAAYFGDYFRQVPEGPTPAENAARLDSQASAVDEIAARVEALGAELGEIGARDVAGEIAEVTATATEPLRSAVTELEARLDGLAKRIEEVSTRLETVAMRPQAPAVDPGEFDEALEAFRSEVNAAIAEATAEIEEARGEAERISEAAFAAEQAAVARAAWGEVMAMLEAGEPYAGPLADAREQVDAEIPDALAAVANDGIATLAELQADFPEAARGALDVSIRSEMGESTLDRVTAFLRVQSGVRSLAPREGDDPDAILSRAEAAVSAGDLETALAEIEALPDTGRAALDGWVARARTRLEVLRAAAAVSAAVNSN